jgi:hypothetical protein
MSEADRIVADYARRAEEVAEDRYAATNPGHLFIRQTVERALVGMLRPVAPLSTHSAYSAHPRWGR